MPRTLLCVAARKQSTKPASSTLRHPDLQIRGQWESKVSALINLLADSVGYFGLTLALLERSICLINRMLFPWV